MPGLIRGVARTAAVVGTATAVSNRVSRRQAGRWSEQEEKQAAAEQQAYEAQQYQAIQAQQAQQQYQPAPPQYQQAPPQYQQAPPTYQEPPPAPAPPPPPVAAPADTSAKLAQLQQLGELKAQGILSDAEFEAQKQKILNS